MGAVLDGTAAFGMFALNDRRVVSGRDGTELVLDNVGVADVLTELAGRARDLPLRVDDRLGKAALETGLGGGPMGLFAGLSATNTPDRRLSETEDGVEGSCAKLSMVRS